MCLRIYLNGDGTGRGTHVSLFFVVMKGPNDALLRWPFNQKVRKAFPTAALGAPGSPTGCCGGLDGCLGSWPRGLQAAHCQCVGRSGGV